MTDLKIGTWSRKYSFALLGILLSILVLYLVHLFGFSEKLGIVSVVSTQVVILLITIAFITGQAKIDIEALYGKPSNSLPPPAQPLFKAENKE